MVDPDAFIDGLWEGSKNSGYNESANDVEKRQVVAIDNVNENGIINYNSGQGDIFEIDSLPEQIHHFATNKNLKYTPQFKKIVSKYGLDLNGDWNKERMRHLGRHLNEYHKFILYHMNRIDELAKGNKKIFLEEFKQVKKEVLSKEQMLRKAFWKGEHNEVLQYDLRRE